MKKRSDPFFLRFRWVFVAEGVLGNLLFFLGSVLFLWPGTTQLGVWLFIAGSGLMLVSSVAAALAGYTHETASEHARERTTGA